MQILGVPEWVLIAFLCLLLPWLAVRSRGQVRGIESADPQLRAKAEAALAPGLVRLYLGTLIMLAALGVLSWLVAARWDYDLLGGGAVTARATVWGAGALAAHLALYFVARAWRTPEERKRLMARRLVPRTPAAWAMATVVVLAAGAVEEAAYRGIGALLLEVLTGSYWIASIVLALAFGVAHAVQGRKSMLVVSAMALVMHVLVLVTGTLVVAMVVHVVYDLLAMMLSARAIAREGAAAGPAAAP